MTTKELTEEMRKAIFEAFKDGTNDDFIQSTSEVAVAVALRYATAKINEQRELMSKHLNMRNVPSPKFE